MRRSDTGRADGAAGVPIVPLHYPAQPTQLNQVDKYFHCLKKDMVPSRNQGHPPHVVCVSGDNNPNDHPGGNYQRAPVTKPPSYLPLAHIELT